MNKILQDTYISLLSGDMTAEEAIMVLEEQEVRNIIQDVLVHDGENQQLEYTLNAIRHIVLIAQYVYNNTGISTSLDDAEYDVLYAFLTKMVGTDGLSSVPTKNKNTAHHIYPKLRGSLDKVHYLSDDEFKKNSSRKRLSEWIKSAEINIHSKTGKRVNLLKEEVYVFPKFDGVSAIFEMNESNKLARVLTRGYTEINEAEDISHIFLGNYISENKDYLNKFNMDNKPYGIKTEIVVDRDTFHKMNKIYGTEYKNSRNMVSAILNSDKIDSDKSSMLTIIPLRIGSDEVNDELSSSVYEYPNIRCELNDFKKIREFATSVKEVNGIRTDGVVIRFTNPELHDILGRDNHINNYEFAYKFAEETCDSFVIDVLFSNGLFGRITPVVVIEPRIMKGNTIDNISIGSIGKLKSLGLRQGDEVEVHYDVVPYMTLKEDGERGDIPILLPTTCEECGKELVLNENETILSCENANCPCRIKGKLVNYITKMNIPNISRGIITLLYELGFVKSIEDLYKLKKKKDKIAEQSGFGKKSVDKIIQSIESKMEVDDYIVLGSLGIPGASRRVFKTILSQINILELLSIVVMRDVKELVKFKGIQEKTANKIIEGVAEEINTINYLMKNLNIMSTTGVNSAPKFKVCFSKIRDKELEERILKNGGEVSDSVVQDTTLLIVPDKSATSSKIEKAKKYGIPITTLEEIKLLSDAMAEHKPWYRSWFN